MRDGGPRAGLLRRIAARLARRAQALEAFGIDRACGAGPFPVAPAAAG